MGARTKVGLAILAVLVIAVPAGVVVAADGGSLESTGDDQLTSWTGQPRVASKNWKPVPEIGALDRNGGPHVLIVSAQMTEGQARFRVLTSDPGPALPPGSALFAGKGSSSFTWAFPDGCALGENLPRLEWKRAGAQRAVASVISTVQLFNSNSCF